MSEQRRVRERIELSLDNRQVAAFVIGSLVVLGMVFALGVLVGKQLASSAMAGAGGAEGDRLARIDAKEKARKSAEAAAKPSQPLTFPAELTKQKAIDSAKEPLKGAENGAPVTGEPKGAPATEKASDKVAAASKPDASTQEVGGSEEKEKKAELSGAFEKAKRRKSETRDEGSGGGEEAYGLQVASLPSRSDADRLVEKLAAKGYAAQVKEASVPGRGAHFRVRLGAYSSREDAEKALRRFKKKVGMNAIVVSTK